MPEEKLGGWDPGVRGSLLGHRRWSHDMTEQAPCVSVPSLEPRLEGRLSRPPLAYPNALAGLTDKGTQDNLPLQRLARGQHIAVGFCHFLSAALRGGGPHPHFTDGETEAGEGRAVLPTR